MGFSLRVRMARGGPPPGLSKEKEFGQIEIHEYGQQHCDRLLHDAAVPGGGAHRTPEKFSKNCKKSMKNLQFFKNFFKNFAIFSKILSNFWRKFRQFGNTYL